MSGTIAFLSGKGGSGKTTLALSVADLLCNCGVRTLLTDCDLSTNGATYFHEARLRDRHTDHEPSLLSFSDLFQCEGEMNPKPLNIKPGLDFFPSVSGISDEYFTETNLNRDSENLRKTLRAYVSWARDNYDVILFDCQAGYADFMPQLLPLMDVNLFVLEPDSISASAMRSLHLKIGKYLGRNPYQVFNKATAEEYEIYSKIDSTFFTNIGTLLFDWKIRQAFSRSRIPDLENASAKYGAELCEICKTMLQDDTSILTKLNHFSDTLKKRELEEKAQEIAEQRLLSWGKLNHLNHKRILRKKRILTSFILMVGAFILLLFIESAYGQTALEWFSALILNAFGNALETSEKEAMNFATVIVLCCLIAPALMLTKSSIDFIMDDNKELEETRQSYEVYGQSLKELESELKKLNRGMDGKQGFEGQSQT